jgi:hypothetical protein
MTRQGVEAAAGSSRKSLRCSRPPERLIALHLGIDASEADVAEHKIRQPRQSECPAPTHHPLHQPTERMPRLCARRATSSRGGHR